MTKPTDLAAAYFLAEGSYGTAKNLAFEIENQDFEHHNHYTEHFCEEVKRLAANFLRIREILKENGVPQ